MFYAPELKNYSLFIYTYDFASLLLYKTCINTSMTLSSRKALPPGILWLNIKLSYSKNAD